MNKFLWLFIIALTFTGLYGQTETKILTINEAVQLGLKNNPEIKKAYHNIESSKGRFWSGISLPKPEVGVSYEYAPVNSALSNHSERTIEISQSFEFPSNYFLKGNKLNKEEDITYYKLKQTENSIISKILSAYSNVLAKKEQLKIAEENLSVAEEFSRKAEIKYNVGEGTNIEKLTAKVQYTEALNNVEILKNDLKSTYAELNYSLGSNNNDEIYKLNDSLFFNGGDTLTFEKYFELASLLNLDIKIAEIQVNSSSIDKSLAWSSLLPSLNLSYYKQSRDGNNGFYGAGFGISIPLWFMFENKGLIQEASAEEEIAKSELQIIKNEVYLKLKKAFNEHQNNIKQVRLYQTNILPQADEIFRSASASYDAGEISYLEFLQARQTFINAKSNYINILLNNVLSNLELINITGLEMTQLFNGVQK
ncbi:MAG TPA: TolC family protein [Ignavibacteriaceae bacterium]|nr:TolC family protein [Ignavibacteriaceae bacterium]